MTQPSPIATTPRGRNTGLVSPCISICTIDETTGFCKGCLRTRQEIKTWLKGTRPEQLQILQTLKERRTTLNTTIGSRTRRITKRQRR